MSFSLALFRHNQVFTLSLLLGVILFLWIPTFIEPFDAEYKGMPLFHLIHTFTLHSKTIGSILAFLILLSEAIYINFVVTRHDLVIKSTYIPSALFILLASFLPDFRSLSPTLCAGFFILLALDRLLQMYKLKTVDNLIFNASFLTAIASLISFQAMLFYLIVIVSLIIFRPFSWREWAISLVGLIVPYIFLITIVVVFDLPFIDKEYFSPKHLFLHDVSIISRIIGLGTVVLVVFFAYWKITNYLNSTTVKIKKGYTLLTWVIIASFLSFLLFQMQENNRFAYLAIPFSIVLSNYFIISSKSIITELLFILVVVAAVFMQINYLYHII